jgi:hypothetical protein
MLEVEGDHGRDVARGEPAGDSRGRVRLEAQGDLELLQRLSPPPLSGESPAGGQTITPLLGSP